MVRLQRTLLGAMAAFWLTLGLLAVTGVIDFGLSSGVPVLGVLMLGNGAVLLLGAVFSARGRRWVDVLVLLALAVNAVLSITDEIGALDVMSLLFSVVLMALVFSNMRGMAAARKE